MNRIAEFLRREDGQDGVEYALLIGFVSSVVIATAPTFTTAFTTFWSNAAVGLGKAGTNAKMP